MIKEKNLFLPLNSGPYEDFEAGVKGEEYRLYGPRWNEINCRIGRRVTLSKGYGKKNRLYGTVVSFRRIRITDAPEVAREIYPETTDDIAAIGIELD